MKIHRFFVIGIGVTLVALAGCARGPSAVTGTSDSAAEATWVYGGEDVWIPVIDVLGQDLGKASRALKNKQPIEAAAALRDGAAFLEQGAERVTPEGRVKMKAAAARLTKLAETIDGDTPISPDSFHSAMREVYAVDVDYLWSTADVEQWMPFVQQVEEHMQTARDQLVAGNPQEVATELRKTAALLRLEAGRIGGNNRKTLEASWFEVRQLGAKAQTGALTDVVRLERVAARTNQVLAQAHVNEARRLWDEHHSDQAAQLLGAAADEYDRALAWIGAQNEESAKAGAENARRLVYKIAASPTPPGKEIADGFDQFDIAVASLGKRLEPSQS